MASGDIVPFDVRLERAGTEGAARDRGRADGKFEILSER